MRASNQVIRLALCGSALLASASAQAQYYCPRDVTRPSQLDCDSIVPRQQRVPIAQQLLPHELAPHYAHYGYAAVPYTYAASAPHAVAYPPVYPQPVYAVPVRDEAGAAVAFLGAALIGAALTRGAVRSSLRFHYGPRR
jgi:hypothetical protein